MISDTENWLIIGAGAIGLLWYSKLTDLKLKVTLLHRHNTKLGTLSVLDNISNTAYTLNEISNAIPLKDQFNSDHAPIFNRILFCTKSFDLVEAYHANKHYISDDAILITLCNGMGAQQTLDTIKSIGQSLFIGTTSEGALKLDKHQIRKTGQGDIFIGSLSPSDPLPINLTPYYTANIEEKLLTKLAINAVINPMTALFNVKNGQLLDPDILPYYQACRNEVCNFLKTYGFDAAKLSVTIDAVTIKTASNRSSMLQDFSGNRQTEINFISGYLLSEATKVNHKMPIQALLLDFIANKRDKHAQILIFNAFL
ncbi:hypothetical protein A9Q77_08295 [Marinomonas sp. 42_23_T18]|nr:hypothetical protein A9Q77_08295 [Marinomonas sp. 42_23_T18]